jgi:hypothetical protein
MVRGKESINQMAHLGPKFGPEREPLRIAHFSGAYLTLTYNHWRTGRRVVDRGLTKTFRGVMVNVLVVEDDCDDFSMALSLVGYSGAALYTSKKFNLIAYPHLPPRDDFACLRVVKRVFRKRRKVRKYLVTRQFRTPTTEIKEINQLIVDYI